MTKNELIYTVYEQLKTSSDDTDISKEYLSSLIDSTRASLIKQTYGNKAWNIPIQIKQELCLGLEPVSNIDGLTCFGKILRTKDKLPAGISIKGAEGAMLSVRTYDRKKLNANIIPAERLPLVGHNPYTSGLLYAALDVDSHLYFTSGSSKHMLMEAIKVEGVYQYPSNALELQCRERAEFDNLVNGVNTDTGGQNYKVDTTAPSIEAESNIIEGLPWKVPAPVEPWDVDYPLEAAMQDQLVVMILQQLISRGQMPEDNTNNAEDDQAIAATKKLGRPKGS